MSMTVRPATVDDLPAIREIAAESPGVPCPENPMEWPTVECAVVELDGKVLGFGYLEAIPEAHLLFRRSDTTREQRRAGVMLLHGATVATALRLKVPSVHLPANPDIPDFAIWASGLPGVEPDPRTHFVLRLPEGSK